MSFWLKQYKYAKDVLNSSFVYLQVNGHAIEETKKKLTSVVEYDDFEGTIDGFYIFDKDHRFVYGQNLVSPMTLLKGDNLRLDLGKVKIDNKWLAEDLLVKDDYI